MPFLNRTEELGLLDNWWNQSGTRLALIWGRRRVGKTAILDEFARHHWSVFHTGAGRPVADELAALSAAAADVLSLRFRDLRTRPFVSWEEAVETMAEAAEDEPLLLVLDEFQELVAVEPDLPNRLRALWDRIRSSSNLRLLLCGSAVRTMEAMQEQRSPLYGRIDLSLLIHPFRPADAAEFLRDLSPPDRALVWGICGGVPLYLSWWDQTATLESNLDRLVCTPGGLLLNEGLLVLAGEEDAGGLAQQVIRAIAVGRTKHNEIEQAVRADPARTLERLVQLRLIDRISPVTEDQRRTRLRLYRIADNFLAFWLTVVERHKTEIERGLGSGILPVIVGELNDFMGSRWEEAFRDHLRKLATAGELGDEVVAVGPFWKADGSAELDAVVLAGRERKAVLVGEAKWARNVDGARRARDLAIKANALPSRDENLRFAVAAREEVSNAGDVVVLTATDMFP